ncbi:trimeric intracellular cation channel family protein [Micrococcus sp.]|uniref:trimeric intracellular cation channel family protein n=1 Tax=Micrococcus sp. TaxID=1271 RepID=UPI002A91E0F5|nr:trimeric intracellular cation channel family protein [Micrococcus sp.]MDY6054964.1 trimeric intracellular cation channel family protein [Micrococcus sp.]
MDLQSFLSSLADLPWFVTALDLVGIFFFAVSGALLAARKDFDFVGSLTLSVLAGLGGGFTRDILLDRGVPASLENPLYLAPPALVSLLVYVKALHPNRLNLTITVFDAAGLALFAVSGVMIAHGMGLHPVSVVVVASVAALGGGVLRDIVANEVPSIFDPRGIYVVPAVLGAALAEFAATHGGLNALSGTLIAALIFTVRMVAYRRGWRFVGADISQDAESLARLRRLARQAQVAAARRAVPIRGRGTRLRAGRRDRGPAAFGPREEFEDQVVVEDYNPDTQAITVVDPASHQSVTLHPATGVMDVTDIRTGRTRSFDEPEEG